MSKTDKDPVQVRGSGRTATQMNAAPIGAVFVWCNERLDYPKSLAVLLNRSDLKLVAPDWLIDRWSGLRDVSAVIIDHAANLNVEQLQGLRRLRESNVTKRID